MYFIKIIWFAETLQNKIEKEKEVAQEQLILMSDPYNHFEPRQAARLAQLGERRSAEREVVSSNTGRTNTQGLKITEEKVLSL